MRNRFYKKIFLIKLFIIILFINLTPSFTAINEIDLKNYNESNNIADQFSIDSCRSNQKNTIESLSDLIFNRIENINNKFKNNTHNRVSSNTCYDYFFQGYITDRNTGNPIENAKVTIIWVGNHLYFNHESVTTDSDGYYLINLQNIAHPYLVYFVKTEGYILEVENLITDFFSYDNGLWINKSLDINPHPRNTDVRGRIVDHYTGKPIEGAVIDVEGRDIYGNYDWEVIQTDEAGYYTVNMVEGSYMPWVHADGYYIDYEQPEMVYAYESFDFNFALYPLNKETAVICGYVNDEDTGLSVDDSFIEFYYEDSEENFPFWDVTFSFTDGSGFYYRKVPAGEISFRLYADKAVKTYNWNKNIEKEEIFWYNFTIKHIPEETSIVTGYVRDESTSNPIENEAIYISWKKPGSGNYQYYTLTDEYGLYRINVPPGYIKCEAFSFDNNRYFDKKIDEEYNISSYETLWLNITLESHPVETSSVYGYAFDKETNEKISNVRVTLKWEEDSRSIHNRTFTNIDGYFYFNTVPGNIYLYTLSNKYLFNHTGIHVYIDDGESVRVDLFLQPEHIDFILINPVRGIYMNNKRILPFILPIVFGGIDIEVNVSDNVVRVHYYVDGGFKNGDRIPPGYNHSDWRWNETSFGKHSVKVIATGQRESRLSKEIVVWKFF